MRTVIIADIKRLVTQCRNAVWSGNSMVSISPKMLHLRGLGAGNKVLDRGISTMNMLICQVSV